MINQINALKLIIGLFFTVGLLSCTDPESKRYVVLSQGGSDGVAPVFLDTKTREVYVIWVNGRDKSPTADKISLDKSDK